MLWEKPGKENTERTVELAADEALKRGIEQIVIASNSGRSALKLMEQEGLENLDITCVTHHVGFREAGQAEMESETRQKLIELGVKVYTGTHVLAGVDRSLKNDFGGLYPPEIMAYTLRMLGQGVKVCVEIGIMAVDAGLINHGENIIAVGGTGRGSDTVTILRPGHSNDVFKTKIVEILCRPQQ